MDKRKLSKLPRLTKSYGTLDRRRGKSNRSNLGDQHVKFTDANRPRAAALPIICITSLAAPTNLWGMLKMNP